MKSMRLKKGSGSSKTAGPCIPNHCYKPSLIEVTTAIAAEYIYQWPWAVGPAGDYCQVHYSHSSILYCHWSYHQAGHLD